MFTGSATSYIYYRTASPMKINALSIVLAVCKDIYILLPRPINSTLVISSLSIPKTGQ